MTVSELIEALKEMPQDSDVIVAIGEMLHGKMYGDPDYFGVPERLRIDKASRDCVIECYYG